MTIQQTIPSPAARASSHWNMELVRAIDQNDDHGMWRLLEQHHDQVAAHHTLATQVARLAYRVADKTRFSEMFLLPVIEPSHGIVLKNAGLWRQADHCIGEALDGWLPSRTPKTVFAGVRPYDWIGTWQPHVMRSHLHSTVPGALKPTLKFLTEEVELPTHAPRLGFVCMVLTSERGWPLLPEANSIRDNRFKLVVGHALRAAESTPAPVVLTPDRVQFAVTDGLCLWLNQLNEAVPISGWSVVPIAASPDVVKVTLKLDSEEVPLTQFTIRKHQIGLQGLDAVLQMLTAIADPLDTPMDCSGPRGQRWADLT